MNIMKQSIALGNVQPALPQQNQLALGAKQMERVPIILQTTTPQIDTSKFIDTTSEEILDKQATQQIGTIGHVNHGKTQTVFSISGVNTKRSQKEQQNNMTINLGYANAKIWKCTNANGTCTTSGTPRAYTSTPSSITLNNRPTCKYCNAPLTLVRHISFVDCPGHEVYMSTMLNGAAVMDAALLLVAANEGIQRQTREHLSALKVLQLQPQNLLVLQNKVDLLAGKKADVLASYNTIKSFLREYYFHNSPVIPVAAHYGYNIDVVLQYICSSIKPPKPIALNEAPVMIIVRSFDVNKPGTSFNKLQGGVAGGSLISGALQPNQEIEIRPGILTRNENNEVAVKPLRTKITSLRSENNSLSLAVPGGLIAVGTTLDPVLTQQNRLVGQLIGLPNKMPDVFSSIEIDFKLLKRSATGNEPSPLFKQKLTKNEKLLFNIGTLVVFGTVTDIFTTKITSKTTNRTKSIQTYRINLATPVCSKLQQKVTVSRKILSSWRLIGYGSLIDGKPLPVVTSNKPELIR